MGFCGAEGVFDGVDAFVAEAGDFDVGADFGRLRGQAFADVGEEFLFDDFRGEGYFLPYIRVSGSLIRFGSSRVGLGGGRGEM